MPFKKLKNANVEKLVKSFVVTVTRRLKIHFHKRRRRSTILTKRRDHLNFEKTWPTLKQPCAEAVVNSRADGLKVTKTQQKNVNKTALSTAEHGRRKIGAEGVPKNFILKEKM